MNKSLKYKFNRDIINIIGRYNSVCKDNVFVDKKFCLMDLLDSTININISLNVSKCLDIERIRRRYYYDHMKQNLNKRYYWIIFT